MYAVSACSDPYLTLFLPLVMTGKRTGRPRPTVTVVWALLACNAALTAIRVLLINSTLAGKPKAGPVRPSILLHCAVLTG